MRLARKPAFIAVAATGMRQRMEVESFHRWSAIVQANQPRSSAADAHR